MSSLTIGVLSLQGDVREHLRALAEVGVLAAPVGSVAELARVDALVIPGGESTTMSKLAISDGLMEPLREARRAGMPMYGSCAGMIMLADHVEDARHDQETIGGIDMTVRRNAFGRQVDSFEADIPVPELGDDALPRRLHPSPVGRVGGARCRGDRAGLPGRRRYDRGGPAGPPHGHRVPSRADGGCARA